MMISCFCSIFVFFHGLQVALLPFVLAEKIPHGEQDRADHDAAVCKVKDIREKQHVDVIDHIAEGEAIDHIADAAGDYKRAPRIGKEAVVLVTE